MQVVKLGAPGDGLAEIDAGLAHIGLHPVLPLHALDVDVQVQLAHAADDGLPRLIVYAHLQPLTGFRI